MEHHTFNSNALIQFLSLVSNNLDGDSTVESNTTLVELDFLYLSVEMNATT